MNDSRKPTVLIIRDGWGVGASDPAGIRRQGNAVAMARTPVRDRLLRERPWCLLRTSGEAVGLPAGQMGNSEVGHLNLGAGRIVHQDVTRISMSISDGSFPALPELAALAATLRGTGGALHLIGLCSDGGVHSEIGHLHALLDWADHAHLPVRLHCVTDGRGHVAHLGRPLDRGAGRTNRGGVRREDRHRVGALLRHGPGQAVGAHGTRLPRGRRGGGAPRERRGRVRRPVPQRKAPPTSSCPRR